MPRADGFSMSILSNRLPKRPLVLDKNILQGWSGPRIRQLAETHVLLVSDDLFYELLTTDAIARARCFGKFEDGENPVLLIAPIGEHLRHELDHHCPLGRPSTRVLVPRFKFHPELRSVGFEFPDEWKTGIVAEGVRVRERVVAFVARCASVAEMVANRVVEYNETRPVALDALRRQAHDIDFVCRWVSGMVFEGNECATPSAEAMDGSWALIRHAQVSMLFAIDVCERYPNDVLEADFAVRVGTKLEHDVLDAGYVALAVLEGAFATRERKLRVMFKSLCPDGLLVTDA